MFYIDYFSKQQIEIADYSAYPFTISSFHNEKLKCYVFITLHYDYLFKTDFNFPFSPFLYVSYPQLEVVKLLIKDYILNYFLNTTLVPSRRV